MNSSNASPILSGSGIQVNPRGIVEFNEIADACNSICTSVNGVTVQAYWSQVNKACIIPVAGKLGMIVYAPQADGSYSAAWGSEDMGTSSGALAWLPVTMNGDGRTQIIQAWDNADQLAMIVYQPQADGSYFPAWGQRGVA